MNLVSFRPALPVLAFFVTVLSGVLHSPPVSAAIGDVTGNILVVRDNTLFEITPEGADVDSVAIPSAFSARGLAMLEDGRIAVFDAPDLRVYNPAADEWQVSRVEGWSSGPSWQPGNGRVEQIGDFIYATDHAPTADPRVVQFSLDSLSGRFIETTNSYSDLAVGPDGTVYGYISTAGDYDILDPDTLAVIESRIYTGALAFNYTDIAVNEAGQKFSVVSLQGVGSVFRFNADDSYSRFLTLPDATNNGGLHNIDIAADGSIVAGGTQVALVDRNIRSFEFVRPGGSYAHTFVRFVDAIIDTDADGMPDPWEDRYGLDSDNAADANDDNDGDGLTNFEEYGYRTNPAAADTDGDELDDYYEINTSGSSPLRPDSDDDGLSDYEEVIEYLTNPNLADSDEDGLGDLDEVTVHGTNPLSGDTDGDDMPDKWELDNGLDPNDPTDAAADADGDGLDNRGEYTATTDPNDADTDGDELSDGDEVNTWASDPLTQDTDGDRIIDGKEVAAGLDPTFAGDAESDPDGDGFPSIVEAYAGSDANDGDSVPVANDWAMHQGDAGHTGYLPLMLDENDFSERWATTVFGENWNVPVTRNGRVFLTTSNRYPDLAQLKALDARDGSERWSTVLESVRDVSTPRIGNMGGATIANGNVYVHTGEREDSALWAFDQVNGEFVFRTPHVLASYPRYSAPTVVGDRAFVDAGYNGYTVGLDAIVGGNLWEVQNANSVDYVEPAYDGEYVYVNYQDDLRALNPDSGEIEFTIQSPEFIGTAVHSPVLGSYNNVIVAARGLVSFDVQNQTVNWAFRDTRTYGQPAVALGQVYVTRDRQLQVYDEATGELLWTWDSPSGRYLEPYIALSATHAFVTTSQRTYAIDLQTQQSVWEYGVGGRATLSNEGALFINVNSFIVVIDIEGDGDGDGLPNWWERVYGLNPEDGSDATSDNDHDGLNALQEFEQATYPDDRDSDDDGLKDGEEVDVYLTDPRDADTDDDGLEDGREVHLTFTDPNNADTDGDRLNDGAEVDVHGSNPKKVDTDGDGMDDFYEVDKGLDSRNKFDASDDRDEDGLTELEEYYGLTDPLDDDTDGDGLIDGDEANSLLTDPLRADTDGDYLLDAVELDMGFDPLNAGDGNGDNDLDGYSNRVEFYAGTDPDFSLSRPEPTDWTTFQANASHSGSNPIVVNLAEISFKWENDISEYGLEQVTTGGGKVFVTDDAYLWYGVEMWTLDEQDGSLLWGLSFDDGRHMNPAAYIDGKVYVSTNDEFGSYYYRYYQGWLRGFDADTGLFIGESPAFHSDDDPLPAATPYGDSLYLRPDGHLISYTGENASVQWDVRTSISPEGTPAVTEDYVIDFVGQYGLISVFDRITGELEHEIDAVYWGFGQTSPVLGDYSNVFISSYPGVLASYNYEEPGQQWFIQEGGWMSHPSAAHGLVYALHDGVLEVRHQFDGSLAWSWTAPDSSLGRTIALTANYVFVTDGAATYAINIATHDMDWSYPKGGDLTISRSGTLLIADDDGVLTAIDLTGDSDGDQLPDSWETLHGLNPADANDADLDPDGDMLTSREEYYLGTNPKSRDTDGDWLPDEYEWQVGLNPLLADADQDQDGDGFMTYYEYILGTDPLTFDKKEDIWKLFYIFIEKMGR